MRELLLAGRRRVHEVLLASDLDPPRSSTTSASSRRRAACPVREVSRGRLEAQARTDAPQGVVAHAAELPEADLDDLARPGAGRRPAVPPRPRRRDRPGQPGRPAAQRRGRRCHGHRPAEAPVRARDPGGHQGGGRRHRAPADRAGRRAARGTGPAARAGRVGRGPRRLGRPTALVDWSWAPIRWPSSSGRRARAWVAWCGPRCDAVVAIPLAGRLGSLNVAAAGALACFEVARRRAPG